MTAGVTTGAFYKHFTSKEALFEEIIQPHINALINMYNEEFTKYLLNLENCLDKLKTIGMINQNLVFNEEEIHFYIYSFYATFYDILKHSYSKEKTMLLTRRLYRFSVPGWIELLS